MEPRQIEIVQETFERLLPQADAAAELFYTNLFASDPSLRKLFPEDMTEQRQKLMTMLHMAVNSLWRPEKIITALQSLGSRHAGYGVTSAHYTTVGNALIATLRQAFGDAFTAEVEGAWVSAYGLIANTMQEQPAPVV